MFGPVDTRLPRDVEHYVAASYLRLYPGTDAGFISRAFRWVEDCFTGRVDGYQAIDAEYHDFEHTLQGAVCLTEMLLGRHKAGALPVLDRETFELCLLGMLFHDTGYLKTSDDNEGTGAKYTAIHVTRSAEFAASFLKHRGYSDRQIRSIQNMIACTGVNVNLAAIPFETEAERIAGFAVGTADLLGQMAAENYIEKLPELFDEFAEAVQYDPERSARLAVYANPQELMRKTPGFWKSYVLPRITNDFLALFRYLSNPYPHGPNPYIDKINANLQALEKSLEGKH